MKISEKDIKILLVNIMLEKKTIKKNTFSCLFTWKWAKQILV
jgi:hypothetical protein